MTPDAQSGTPVRILVVCTGNICRSPFAEFILAALLRDIDADGFDVRSAGTRALGGRAIDGSSAALLGPLAPDAAGFAATQLTADLIGTHDLILTMTREQRSAVLRMRPDALRRVFTLREFARLLDTADPGSFTGERRLRWRALLPALAANRTGARITDPGRDDVVDPFGRGEEVFRRMAEEITPALDRIASFERAWAAQDLVAAP